MKKLMLLFMLFTVSAAEGYEFSGLWNIYGTGFVEKSFVRISLGLSGEMELSTCKVSELSDDVVKVLSNDTVTILNRNELAKDLNCLRAYDINLRVYALDNSGLDVKIWDDNIPNGLRIPIVYPEFEATLNDPFTLPSITQNGLTYTVSFTSETAGKLRVQGYIDTSIGDIELNSDGTIWKEGTSRPSTESETKSGCNMGMGILMMLLAGVYFIVRD